MKNEMKKFESAVNEAKTAFMEGVNGLFKFAQIYAKTITEYPESKKAFKEAIPQLSGAAWSQVEKVGNGAMNPNLLIDTSYGAQVVKGLPIAEQDIACYEGIEVLTADGSCLKVTPSRMTPEQSRIAIAKDHIRDIPEQKAFIETLKLKKSMVQKKEFSTYSINKKEKTVTFNFNWTGTVNELLKIAQEIQS